jgi:GT2 family glycosyltransferase
MSRILTNPQPAVLRPEYPVLGIPRLSVVIVNYCQWDLTADLTAALLASPCVQRGEAEVVVVDNHSPPDRILQRLRRLPGVSLRRWGRNRGFGRAANEGCRLSRGGWLLLLNPDTSIAAGFLDQVLALAGRLERDEPRTGIVGFELRNPDGSRQGSCGSFPTLGSTLAGLLRPRAWRKYHTGASRRRTVDWVTGCGLLVRRACWEQLGGFDRRFFLYYEDVDLCRRARAAGWSVCCEPALHLTHHAPLHARRLLPHLRLFTRHALLTYAARHWPRWQVRLLGSIVRVEAWLRQRRARWLGRPDEAEIFAVLGAIARDLCRDRPMQARRRLEQVVHARDKRLREMPIVW